jgi:crossover junction endodeoxyribonuclease RuvC
MSVKGKVILGIDPGTQILGFGLIESYGKSGKYIDMGIVDLRKLPDHFSKLSVIFERVEELIEKYSPDEVAIEAPFYGKNVQSMLKLGRAQGAAISCALNNKLPVTEYAPRKIKMAITGKGAASKEQVASILCNVLKISELPKRLDATDALAVAYCHLINSENILAQSSVRKSDWNSFVKNNPGRIK